MLLRLWVTLMIAAVITTLASCTLRTSVQPSILVILVEDLGFGAFSCGEGEEGAQGTGFQTLCDEAVRFTHAFTPSVMSQATVASILTGRLPRELGVRHNGAQGISAPTETVAEVALTHGYRTAFFSGGPPIFRRGLNQGFELFDDNFPVSVKKLYRSVNDLVSVFLNWQSSETPRGGFLTFLYLPDLQFPDTPTVNDLGEVRESSFHSQVEEVDESLGTLFKELKRRKLWDSTDIFLVGLNGYPADVPDERIGELQAANLFSEATHATLMIKPSLRKKDALINRKIDFNVSLIDVGTTLFDLIAGRFPRGLIEDTSSGASLKSALVGAQPEWSAERMITSESAWPEWRHIGGIRAAVRRGSYLYVLDDPDGLYNTLTDSLEASPLPLGDEHSYRVRMELSEYLRGFQYDSWRAPERVEFEKLSMARDLWHKREVTDEDMRRLRALNRRFPKDPTIAAWRAIFSIRRSDWTELKDVAGKNRDRVEWAFVAARNLGEKWVAPTNPCLVPLIPLPGKVKPLPKDCAVNGVRELYQWVDESLSEPIRTRAQDFLVRMQSEKALSSVIATNNLANGWVWDTSIKEMTEPDPIDLILALPELKRYRAILKGKLDAIEAR
jgi:hypothetical protein